MRKKSMIKSTKKRPAPQKLAISKKPGKKPGKMKVVSRPVSLKSLEKMGKQAIAAWIKALKKESKLANKKVTALKKELKALEKGLKANSNAGEKKKISKVQLKKQVQQKRLQVTQLKALHKNQAAAATLVALLQKAVALQKIVVAFEQDWVAPSQEMVESSPQKKRGRVAKAGRPRKAQAETGDVIVFASISDGFEGQAEEQPEKTEGHLEEAEAEAEA